MTKDTVAQHQPPYARESGESGRSQGDGRARPEAEVAGSSPAGVHPHTPPGTGRSEQIEQIKNDALEFAARLCEVKARDLRGSDPTNGEIRAAGADECAIKIRSRKTPLVAFTERKEEK